MKRKIVWGFSILAAFAFGAQSLATNEIELTSKARSSSFGTMMLAQNHPTTKTEKDQKSKTKNEKPLSASEAKAGSKDLIR